MDDSNVKEDDDRYINSDLDSDPEIVLLTNLRVALSSFLHMLEKARDDLIILGSRIDRLTAASQAFRSQIIQIRSKKETIEAQS